MTVTAVPDRRSRLIGFGLLLGTALGWGLNWPATKYLLQACPPLTARGLSGIVAAAALAGLAWSRGESLILPRGQYGRLVVAALLNVSAWMGLTTVSMVWLPAGEAATLAYTMPVWAALLAWPLLGERLTPRRALALGLGLCGVGLIAGGVRLNLDSSRLPGLVAVLLGAVLFAFGTVLSKRYPIAMRPVALTAWQVGLGCLPLLLAGILFEHAHLLALPAIGWVALGYTAAVSLGLCYLAWFAALRRLDAGMATIGMLLTPIIGVLASAIALGEPLLPRQLGALLMVLVGMALASRKAAPRPIDRHAIP